MKNKKYGYIKSSNIISKKFDTPKGYEYLGFYQLWKDGNFYPVVRKKKEYNNGEK